MTMLKIVPCSELPNTAALAAFFEQLVAAGVDQFFHPHPFTAAQAAEIVAYGGQDVYVALCVGSQVAGYGMLRGWDEGYVVPSLGIAISAENQGQGLGRLLMNFLHAAARLRNAPRIRLKVYPDNAAAHALYQSLGYQFGEQSQGQLVGYFEL